MDSRKPPSLLFRLTLALLCVLLAWVSATQTLDERANELTDRSLTRAIVAFGISRGLNGVISIAQGTEISIQPGGLGLVLTPGQILDPINDLVERISWIMLAASTSLGIQKVLLSIAAWPYFALFCSVGFLLVAVLAFRRRSVSVSKLALFLLVLRFGVAFGAIGSELMFDTFLEPRYAVAKEELEATTTKLRALQPGGAEDAAIAGDANAEKSFLERLKSTWNQASSVVDIQARLEHYRSVAETTSKAAIDLVVVFIFQTVVFPLVFLAVLIATVKRSFR